MTGLLFALLVVPALAWVFLFRDLIRGVDPRSPLPSRWQRRFEERMAAALRVDRGAEAERVVRAFASLGKSMLAFSDAANRTAAVFASPAVRRMLEKAAEAARELEIERARRRPR